MLNNLPPRERQIVDMLYERGAMAVSDICDSLPDRLSGSAVRAMLTRLEQKGFVQRESSDRGFLFSPTVTEAKASSTALGQIVRTFFNGSPVSAASALLGMSEKLEDSDLDELEAMIAAARARKGA
ncbi:BlaI/MecI/CopY family transcriptional regulator [Sphingomonas sp. R-74633]|uniref:BlaI/MecI/CopY family transcriptional regulator n=1 Tax=Sphingomonas sp. R-74633 TaxID=2751188 RepID=UPI0015D3A161|nr:BlaI/MecI/CopY family transcriptional regulator [Sphingomonas sp. R-74633]NYT39712.1 BlaI/MecI/CopY family transcriptional regulator [Sphingomonas sp. R-74633]